MSFFYGLLRLDPDSRSDIISATSIMGVIVNILVAGIKVVIGIFTSSIAIVSEGVNNAADALTSVLAFIGAKLAKKHPDEKHPFGYGRIEYLSSLIIASLILISGVEMLIGSVKLVFSPEELSVSYLSIAILVASAIIKYALGMYTIKMGKKAESGSLIGVGTECRNDSFASVITIVSAGVYIFFKLNVDAYAGIIISLLIIKAGIEVLRETVSDLLGRPGEQELAEKIYRDVRRTDKVIAAADMMLHNYGPDAWSGSVNIEMDHNITVGEAYRILHRLQLRIMHEYNVTMVFGIYAVDNDNTEVRALRSYINEFVLRNEHINSYHAVYVDELEKKIYCDFIVDYKLQDWDSLKSEFTKYIYSQYPEYELELTIETEFV